MRVLQLISSLLIVIVKSESIRGDDSSCIGNSIVDGDAPSCTASTISTTGSSSTSTIQIPQNSSIINFFDPELLEEDILADIKINMLSGKLVVIEDAFIPEFAEHVWEQLSKEDVEWQHENVFHPQGPARIPIADADDDDEELKLIRDKVKVITKAARSNNKLRFHPDNGGYNARKKEAAVKNSTELEKIMAIFNHTSTKDLMSSISGRSCSGNAAFVPTEYGYGDYANPHTDFKGLRSVNFEWTLTKDWDPTWGGSFYWGPSKTLQEGYFFPTFNTLFLFLPTMVSTHMVAKVNRPVESRRLSIKGEFYSGKNDAINVDEPIESVYRNKEDHIHLTADEAVWIAHDLDPMTYTNDTTRQQNLRNFKQSIIENYLCPDDDASFIVNSTLGVRDENGNEESTSITENINITANSSILDFLDPSILQDTNLLSEISTNLHKGKLVVIQDAFKTSFAEYARKQLDKDDIWVQGKFSPKINVGRFTNKSLVPYPSQELKSVHGVFQHAKTKEFFEEISGRSCSGPGPKIVSTCYRQGDHSNPHRDGKSNFSLVWNLSKDFDPTFGGALYWFPSKTLDAAYSHPTFNTLFLFITTPSSIHAVTPVAEWGEGKRLTMTAFYESQEIESAVKNGRLEELTMDENNIGLTDEQVEKIVYSMNVDRMTRDPVRRQKLFEFKEKVAKKYVHPSSDDTYVLESSEESET